MHYLDMLLNLVKEKYEYEKATWSERATHVPYIEDFQNEFEEVKEEITKHNTVFLEDELGDMLWDLLNTIYCLEQEGYITDHQNVFKRSYEKFRERIDDKYAGIERSETKARQKQRRLDEHNQKHG